MHVHTNYIGIFTGTPVSWKFKNKRKIKEILGFFGVSENCSKSPVPPTNHTQLIKMNKEQDKSSISFLFLFFLNFQLIAVPMDVPNFHISCKSKSDIHWFGIQRVSR